jgi:23S rRNA (adenine2503-C2)-methyltransferase
MGFGANLSAAEILDQVVQAGQLVAHEGRTIRNIVLMGMGEPFHNESQVFAALESLVAGDLFNHPASRVLISTVGIPEVMLRCAKRFPDVHLALSLHAVRQEVRESLIPLARKFPLERLRETIIQLNQLQKSPVMLEYLMLRGINDSPADAADLIAFARGLRVHLNLIPFNPIEAAPHLEGSDRPTRDEFARRLKQAGLTTTIRYSMGADIEAACGQLVQQLERRRQTSVASRQP